MPLIHPEENEPTTMTRFVQEAMSDITTMLSSYVYVSSLMEHYKAENERLKEELANAGELVVEEHACGCKYCDVEEGSSGTNDIRDEHVVVGALNAYIDHPYSGWFLRLQLSKNISAKVKIDVCPFCGRRLT